MLAPTSLDQPELQKLVHSALRAWHDVGGSDDSLLADLLLVQERRAALDVPATPVTLRQLTSNLLAEGIAELAAQDPDGAQVLRARFDKGETAVKVSFDMGVSADTVNRWQRQAIDGLATILLSRETALRERRLNALLARLPAPTYAQLFGMDSAQAELTAVLLNLALPPLVALIGIGGIGKTSLALAVTRAILPAFRFDQVVWLTVHGEGGVSDDQLFANLVADLLGRLGLATDAPASLSGRLEMLQAWLRKRPCLIILDNLESKGTASYLAAEFHRLIGGGKCLLTSRVQPEGPMPLFLYPLNELPLDAAGAYLRHLAASSGRLSAADVTDDHVRQIYRITGGNPLALKLVISLAGALPLSTILADLERRSAGPVDDLYRHIYWQAWHTLSGPARILLQAMPLAADAGAGVAQMKAFSQLDDADITQAILELVARSLLEMRDTSLEKRYGIHRLTDTFVRTQIVGWPDEG